MDLAFWNIWLKGLHPLEILKKKNAKRRNIINISFDKRGSGLWVIINNNLL